MSLGGVKNLDELMSQMIESGIRWKKSALLRKNVTSLKEREIRYVE